MLAMIISCTCQYYYFATNNMIATKHNYDFNQMNYFFLSVHTSN